MAEKLTQADLAQFTGSERWYRHSLMRTITYTEGVQFLAEKAGAYWLVDKIATLQLEPKIKREEFQAWKLTVAENRGKLLCEDGNGNAVYREEIEFTDFPLDEIMLWYTNSVIMLPSEY
jgi:hypothetical protein